MWKKMKLPLGSAGDGANPATTRPAAAAATVAAAAPPPAYGSESYDRPAADAAAEISAAFGTLDLGAPAPGDPRPQPNEDTCLAHLRLLTAFNRLKAEIGYRDGLWDIWDSRAKVAAPPPAAGGSKDAKGKDAEAKQDAKAAEAAAEPSATTASGLNEDVLVKIREKRWAIYVGRAVDRYVAWWQSFVPDMLLEDDMVGPAPGREDRYEGFPTSQPMVWNANMLPPLGTSHPSPFRCFPLNAVPGFCICTCA